MSSFQTMLTLRMDKLLIILCCVLVSVKSVIITTPQGLLDGKIETVTNYGEITKFLGIPYARPPVDNLRFQPPRPFGKFSGTYDAKYGRWVCPQPDSYLPLLNLTADPDVVFRTNEDCLYLNVYIPGTVRLGSNLPVMVWIHGGSWQGGSGTHYDGRKLAAMGKVIVVTLNYRLGILGFVPDGTRAGTLGLQDQIAALKWVRWNIWSFGGDPGMVTIFGESAGGASVSFLTSSPAASDLFHRAISQSGLKTSSWALDEPRRAEKMKTLAMKLRKSGCKLNIEECLRQATSDQLVGYTQFVMSSLALSAWTPHVDGYVITANVLNSTALMHPVDRMIGFNSDEGGIMVDYMCIHESGQACRFYEGISYTEVRRWTAYDMDLMSFERIGERYLTWYPGPRREGRMSLSAAAAFTSDWYEEFPANRTASAWRDRGREIWVYEFNAKPKDKLNLLWEIPWSQLAQHGDELPFLFGFVKDKGDQLISNAMINYWTSFAKGRPSSAWPQFGPHNKYLYIGRLDTKPINFEIRQPLIPAQKEQFWRPWFQKGEFPPDQDKQVAEDSSATQLLPGVVIVITSLLTCALRQQ